tara:strand:- start:2843 stop:3280 length:438 start_codon:yes stop_codon:yes gene_type:complete
MDSKLKEMLMKVHDIGTHTSRGAFLFHVMKNGLLFTLFSRMMLFFIPKSARAKVAKRTAENARDRHVEMVVDDPDGISLVVYMTIVSNYTFLLGSSNNTMSQALMELRQVIRKAHWRLANQGKDCSSLEPYLQMFRDSSLPTATP